MTTLPEDIATATPVQIDTRLSQLDHEHYRHSAYLVSAISMLHTLDGQRAHHRSRSVKVWPKSDADTVTAMRTKLADGSLAAHEPWHVGQVTDQLAKHDEATSALQDNRAEFGRLQDEYERRPWRRYIAVQGGHIHSGYWCAGGTIRPTTIRQWAPTLSGKPVADAVAELGPTLCTHCFPEAPVEWQAGEAPKPRCVGSGQGEVSGSYRRQGVTGRGQCRECGTWQTVTGRGLIRAHAPADKEKEAS